MENAPQSHLPRRRVRARRIIVLIVLLAVCVWVLLPGSFARIVTRMRGERPFLQAKFAAVVFDIQRGELVPNSHGIATLRDDRTEFTADGRVYVTKLSGGRIAILFVAKKRTFDVVGGWVLLFTGYLYYPALPGDREEIIVTQPFGGSEVGPAAVAVKGCVAKDWYYVVPVRRLQ